MKTKPVSVREAIYLMFRGALDEEFDSKQLHRVFGTSFRSRVSEINNQTGDIFIFNVKLPDGRSVYYSKERAIFVAEAA